VKAPESITIGTSGGLGRFLAGIAPAENFTACDAVFDSIFRTDPKTKETISDVLDSWQWTDDTTFVMKMKQNVVFSNGDPATADDLIFSYANHKERGSNYLNSFGLLLDQCVATDKYTATFKFEKPYSAFTNTIIYLVDKAWSQKVGWDSQEWYKPVGSGPYKCTEYVADDHITLQARDDYWNKDAGPIAVKEWIIKNYPDQSTMFMDLETGNINYCEVQSADYSRFLKDGGDGYKCVLMPTGVNLYFNFGFLDNPIWKNQKLREAIACGINWTELGKLAYGDMFVPAKSLVPEFSPQFINPGEVKFDQDKAKQLLTEAGYSAGQLKLKTFMMETPLYKNLCESFQFYAQQIGIDVSIEYGDISTSIAKWVDPAGGIDFGFIWYVPGSPAGSLRLNLWNAGDKHGLTWAYIDDDEFQKLFTDVVYTTDKDLALKSAKEIQQLAFDKTLVVPIAENATSIGYGTNMLNEAQVKDFFSGSGNLQISRLGLASAWN
jgi:peptide/nickel transport system substrate-binding protein